MDCMDWNVLERIGQPMAEKVTCYPEFRKDEMPKKASGRTKLKNYDR